MKAGAAAAQPKLELRRIPLVIEKDQKTGQLKGRLPTPGDAARFANVLAAGGATNFMLAPSDLNDPANCRGTKAGPPIKKLPPMKKDEKGLGSNIWVVTAALVGLQGGSVAAFTQLPKSVTGWATAHPNFLNPLKTFTKGPHFDSDGKGWNYISHPVSGAEYYLLARNRGIGPLGSLGYSAALSTWWEIGPEAIYERASIQDLIITPVAGALLGELRYQAKQALVDKKTGKAKSTLNKILVVVIDPVDALLQ